MAGTKKNIKLNTSKIAKDEDGFEDLDQFWDAADTNTTARTSITAVSRLSDADSLNYDDTGSISDGEEDDADTFAEESTTKTPAPRGRPPKGGRGSKSTDADDSALPFEDTPATFGSISPFPQTASPMSISSRGGGGGRGGASSSGTNGALGVLQTSSSSSGSGSGPGSGGRDGARGRGPAALAVLERDSIGSVAATSAAASALAASGRGRKKSTSGRFGNDDDNDDNNDDDDGDYGGNDNFDYGGGGGGGGDDDYGADAMNTAEEDEQDSDQGQGRGRGRGRSPTRGRKPTRSTSPSRSPPTKPTTKAQQQQHQQRASDASSRRVSFGQGTKGVDSASSSPKSKGGASGKGSKAAVLKGKGKGPTRTPDVSVLSTATTPESSASNNYSVGSARSVHTMAISTPGSHDFARGRALPDESFVNDDDDEDDDDEEEDTDGEGDSGIDASFIAKLTSKKRKVGGGDNSDDEDEDAEDEYGNKVRRSKRATKGKKLEFWKGERVVYDRGQMIGVLTANPTPAKPKRPKQSGGNLGRKNNNKGSRKGSGRGGKSSEDDNNEGDDDEAEAEFDDGTFYSKSKNGSGSMREVPVKVPKDLKLLSRDSGDELQVWDDGTDAAQSLKVVCYQESLLPPSALPITAIRPPGKDKVGFAAQSFNVAEIPGVMSGWISGFVELPAGAIKDAEGVGECAQVFFLSDCQDGAVELGIADPSEPEWQDDTAQRQLLNKGDSFFVPPGNIYRIENHSSTKSALVHWCIVKPLEPSPSPSAAHARASAGAVMDQDV